MAGETQDDHAAAYRARLLAVVGAIASSIGVVGFVAVVGGMVVWLRFDALHLPADTAVAAIPRTNLIVIGLSTLIPFIVLGLVTAFLAYIFAADNLVPSRPWNDLGTLWSGTGDLADLGPVMPPFDTAGLATDTQAVDRQRARLAEVAQEAGDAVATARAAAKVGQPKVVTEQTTRIQDLSDTLAQNFRWLEELHDSAPAELVGLKPHLEQVKRTLAAAKDRAEQALTEANNRRKLALVTRYGSALALLAVEMGIVFVVGGPSTVQVIILIAIGIVLAYCTLRLGSRTQGFAVFGSAIFISILLFGTATTLFRTFHTPKVQPVALLRAGRDQGLTGYFVAQTSDRVYLVRILGERKGKNFQTSFPRLVVIPRSNVVSMEVGPLQLQETAYGTSYRALEELCAQKLPEETTRTTSHSALVHCGQQH